MSILDRIQRRSNIIDLTEPTQAWFGALSAQSSSGKTVSPATGLQLVPVFSAIQLISGAIASLPLKVYRQLPDGGKVATPRHMAQGLIDRPNSVHGGGEFRQIMAVHLLTWGNFYGYKERDASGRVTDVWPLTPSRVRVSRRATNALLDYWIDGQGPFDERTILHVRGLSSDGVVGLSPIQQARNSLGTAMSLEEYQGAFWKNGARPSGVLKHPQRLTAEAAQRLRAQWESSHGSSNGNMARVSVLEEGMSYENVSLPAEDSQLIESAHFSDIRVAQLYRVPPHMLMTSSKSSMTYSTTELEGRHFVTYCLFPWLARLTEALLRDPDWFIDGPEFFPQFDTSPLTRGDLRTQAETDVALVAAGIITADEARQNLDLNPLPARAGSVAAQPTQPAAGGN